MTEENEIYILLKTVYVLLTSKLISIGKMEYSDNAALDSYKMILHNFFRICNGKFLFLK